MARRSGGAFIVIPSEVEEWSEWGERQSLIEDCSVCCRPINLIVRCQPGAVVDLVYGE